MTAIGTITNDDVAPPTYTLTAANVSAAEGDNVVFSLVLDSAPTEAVTVSYITAAGTGANGAGATDFTPVAGTVTFAAGQTSKLVTIATTEDTAVEGNETFTVTFSGTSLVGSVTATGTITNDDADPQNTVQTFNLTTGSDTFTGFNANDVFDASVVNSLNTFDVLTGGGGTSDTLHATLNNQLANPTTTGIEQFNITSRTNASTLNLINTTGVTGIKNINSDAALSIQNLASVITLDIEDVEVATTLRFTAPALAGGADNLTVNLKDVAGAASVTTQLTPGAAGSVLETITLNTTDTANTFTFDTSATGTTNLAVTGNTALNLGTLSNGLTTVTSTSTGTLAFVANGTGINASLASTNDTVTGGAGNDVIATGGGIDTTTIQMEALIH